MSSDFTGMPRALAAIFAFCIIWFCLLVGYCLILVLAYIKFWAFVIIAGFGITYYLARPLITWIQRNL